MTALLQISDLKAGYGPVVVLKGISMAVAKGEIVALVGANGAGKSTLLNTLSGVVPLRGGHVVFNGQELGAHRASAVSRLGLRHVPEGRRVFAALSVQDNLRLGAYGCSRAAIDARLVSVYEMFPRLAERRTQLAGTMSGGEQQMLAIGRALVAEPLLLMLDEPSMGLAPLVVAEIFRLICRLRDELGIGILLVEQNARAALRIADRACVMSLGGITMQGTGRELLADPAVAKAFLGAHTVSRATLDTIGGGPDNQPHEA